MLSVGIEGKREEGKGEEGRNVNMLYYVYDF